MQETDCEYYFLSATALRLWQTGDVAGQAQMFVCVSAVHKEAFFRGVLYPRQNYPGSWHRELAEIAFFEAWAKFTEKGTAEGIAFTETQWVGYFRKVFKNHYWKLVSKDAKKREADKVFGMKTAGGEEEGKTEAERNAFSPRTQKAFDAISSGCRELLRWRHIEKWSYDQIAAERKVDRESCIKMVSRCGKNLLRKWRGEQ